MRKKIRVVLLVALAAGIAGCSSPDDGSNTTEGGGTEERVRIAYVTNGIDPFWNIAAAGVRAGAKEFDVDCEVLMPPKGIVDQKRMVESLLANSIQGIAISPIDAANQVGFINEAAARTFVITQDSDAPDSDRLCFVGMDNYQAGRAAGKLVKEVMPEGGSVMIFVGRLEQLNAQQRRQGVIDEILDRPVQSLDSVKIDPPGFKSSGARYTFAGTRTDNFDYAKAKSNAEDAIAGVDGLGCMVGLFAYNTPACLTAVREAGKVGEIKLVSFDEADDTLSGIADGAVHGTVSQQPFEYGFQSVRILAGLVRGDDSVLPENGFLNIPIVVVRQDNVEEFRVKLNELKKN